MQRTAARTHSPHRMLKILQIKNTVEVTHTQMQKSKERLSGTKNANNFECENCTLLIRLTLKRAVWQHFCEARNRRTVEVAKSTKKA